MKKWTSPTIKPLPRSHPLYCKTPKDILKKNGITISRRKKNTSWNIIVAIFIYITMDVEHNETTPAITFSTLYEDFDISAQNDVKISRKP